MRHHLGAVHYGTIKSPDVTRLPRPWGNSMDRDYITKFENKISEAEKE